MAGQAAVGVDVDVGDGEGAAGPAAGALVAQPARNVTAARTTVALLRRAFISPTIAVTTSASVPPRTGEGTLSE